MPKRRTLVVILLLGGIVAGYSTAHGQVSPFRQIDLAGKWAGTLTGYRCGAANLEIALVQDGSALT